MRNGDASYTQKTEEAFAIDNAVIKVFDDYKKHNAGLQVSSDISLLSSLRGRYPDWTVTVTLGSTDLIAFAQAGQAKADLDVESGSLLALRLYEEGEMMDNVLFGKYDYEWKGEVFIVYSATLQQSYQQ